MDALRIGGPNGVNAGTELVREELALPCKPGLQRGRIGGCGGAGRSYVQHLLGSAVMGFMDEPETGFSSMLSELLLGQNRNCTGRAHAPHCSQQFHIVDQSQCVGQDILRILRNRTLCARIRSALPADQWPGFGRENSPVASDMPPVQRKTWGREGEMSPKRHPLKH